MEREHYSRIDSPSRGLKVEGWKALDRIAFGPT
jgi:hypothetical protein